MTTVDDLARDLAAEQEVLDAIVAVIDDAAWSTPTASPGWTVADQIAHLTYFEGAAAMAIGEPERFQQATEELLSLGDALDDHTLARGAPPSDRLKAWRTARAAFAGAAAGLRDGARIPWYGPR